MEIVRRILVVENYPKFRESIADYIRFFGYSVSAVGSGEAAINSLQKNRLKIDAVVTSRRLPLMNGEELTRRIKQLRTVPVILIVDDEFREIRQVYDVAHAAGVDEVICKSEAAEKLPAILNSLIGPAKPFG